MAEPKRQGRPPLTEGDTTTPVTVRLPSKDFDRVCERASRERVKVQDLLRRGIASIVVEDDEE